MIADLDTPELEELLTRSLAVDLGPYARRRIRARLEAAPGGRTPLLKRRLRTVAILGLVATLLVAGTAAGIHYFGEWGGVDHPASVAEIEAEVSAAVADKLLPAGYAYPVAWILQNAESDQQRAQHVGTLWVQHAYMCAWTDDWLGADHAGDDAGMAAALPMIEGFPRLLLVGDPRFAGNSIRDEITQVVAGAKKGDAAPVQELWLAACSENWVVRQP